MTKEEIIKESMSCDKCGLKGNIERHSVETIPPAYMCSDCNHIIPYNYVRDFLKRIRRQHGFI